MRGCWGGAMLAVLLNCAGDPSPMYLPPPGSDGYDAAVVKLVASREKPAQITDRTAVCILSCPAGWMFRPQHLCRNGQRWFQDAIAKDRKVTRGADGTVLSDTWVTDRGDYAAVDVERGTCSMVISRIIASRDAEERGRHPGEDEQGRPEPPR